MTHLCCTVTTTPQSVIVALTKEIAGGDTARLIDHVVSFGLPIAIALAGGAKIATGSDFLGYREVGVTLSGPIDPFPGLALSFVFECEIADVPTGAIMGRVAELLHARSHGEALDRLMYWFWVAAQLASISRPLFIMDHEKGRWDAYTYRPLWDARTELGF